MSDFINFSFESQCSYTVALDAVDNTFTINLEPKATHTAIKIFAQDKAYTLTLSGKYQYDFLNVSEMSVIGHHCYIYS